MSTIKVNAIQNTSGVEQYLCKAWVNFGGVGTVSIRASGNVTSITDNGTGDYTVNFTSALADPFYAFGGAFSANGGNGPGGLLPILNNTTSCRVRTIDNANNLFDPTDVYCLFFR